MKTAVTIALGVSLVLAGCGNPPPSEYPTHVTNSEPRTLASDDVVEVRIFYGANELVREYRIGPHGNIGVPYIGKVELSGRSASEVEQEIQQRLADGYLKNPIVSLNIKEQNSKKVAIMGQVKTPGTLRYFEGMTIVEAVSQAGGFTAMAKTNAVTVTRVISGESKRYTVPVGAIAENKAKNFPMLPGDAIFVPERLF